MTALNTCLNVLREMVGFNATSAFHCVILGLETPLIAEYSKMYDLTAVAQAVASLSESDKQTIFDEIKVQRRLINEVMTANQFQTGTVNMGNGMIVSCVDWKTPTKTQIDSLRV